MKKTILKLIIIIVSFVFFINMVILLLFTSKIDKQTDNTTTYYSATVSNTKIWKGKDIYVNIRTNEYDNDLTITTSIEKNINLDDVRNLQNGQKIFFRIENYKTDDINKVPFIDIVSLSTETKDIFTLDDYNKFMSVAAYPGRIVGFIVALLFLSISVYNLFTLIRKAKYIT